MIAAEDQFTVAGVPAAVAGSGEPATPTALESRPTRTLTAKEVGEATGREKRIVLRWADEGLEHDVREVRGRPTKFFAMDEVQAFLRSRGLDQKRRAAAAAAEGPGLVEDHFAALMAEINSPTDPEAMVRRARLTVARLFKAPPAESADAAEKQRWAQAFKHASSELRMLEDEAREWARRRGEVLDRRAATRALASLGAVFAAEASMLGPRLGEALVLRLAADGLLTGGSEDLARRVVAHSVGAEFDALRTRIAAAIEAAGGELDRLAAAEVGR